MSLRKYYFLSIQINEVVIWYRLNRNYLRYKMSTYLLSSRYDVLLNSTYSKPANLYLKNSNSKQFHNEKVNILFILKENFRRGRVFALNYLNTIMCQFIFGRHVISIPILAALDQFQHQSSRHDCSGIYQRVVRLAWNRFVVSFYRISYSHVY